MLFKKPSNVISLKSSNIHSSVGLLSNHMQKQNTLIFIQAKWCYYTQQFFPVWEQLLKKIEADKNLTIIKINDEAIRYLEKNNKEIFQQLADFRPEDQRYKVFFPTIILFSNGQRYKFEQERTVENLIKFIYAKRRGTHPGRIPRLRTKQQARPQARQQIGQPPKQQTRQKARAPTRSKPQPRRVINIEANLNRKPVKLTLQEQINKAFLRLMKKKSTRQQAN